MRPHKMNNMNLILDQLNPKDEVVYNVDCRQIEYITRLGVQVKCKMVTSHFNFIGEDQKKRRNLSSPL
jgi:hypothetical protein